MTAGPVNQALLESNYQNAGDVYDDTKTEGAFQVIVNQVNDNWFDYAGVKSTLNSVVPGSSGSEYIKSAPIAGVAGNTVHAQIADIEQQFQSLVGGSIPTSSITYDKLNPNPAVGNVPDTIPIRNSANQLTVGAPTLADHAATKSYVDGLYVTGNYTGNDAASRDIALPFTPSLVVTTQQGITLDSTGRYYGSTVTPSAPNTGILEIGVNKFTVHYGGSSGASAQTNTSALVYSYFAFK